MVGSKRICCDVIMCLLSTHGVYWLSLIQNTASAYDPINNILFRHKLSSRKNNRNSISSTEFKKKKKCTTGRLQKHTESVAKNSSSAAASQMNIDENLEKKILNILMNENFFPKSIQYHFKCLKSIPYQFQGKQ